MLPGVGVPALTDTVIMARRAAELGCRGALVLPPFFYKNPSEDGLFAYYSEVIQRVGGALKLYFYHFPAQSAVPITVSLIERLLRAYPGAMQGIKDSTGDWSNTKSYIDHFAAEGFEVYCGDDGHLLQMLQAGGAGSISAASNVSVAMNAKVYANWNRPEGCCGAGHADGDARRRDLGGADPRAEGARRPAHRRSGVGEHPPAACEVDGRGESQAVRRVRRLWRGAGEGGLNGQLGDRRHPERVEPVATAFRDQQAGIARIRLDLLAQAVDMRLQRVRGDVGVVAPDLVQQHLARDRPGAGAVEEFQDRRLLLGQADAAVLDGLLQQLGAGPKRIRPDGEDRVLAVLEDAELGAQPGQQLGQPERLGDVVVGAGIEAAHHVRLVVRAGQHDDRHAQALLAQVRAQVAPVAIRQPDIQDDRVEPRVPAGHHRLGLADGRCLGGSELPINFQLLDQSLP